MITDSSNGNNGWKQFYGLSMGTTILNLELYFKISYDENFQDFEPMVIKKYQLFVNAKMKTVKWPFSCHYLAKAQVSFPQYLDSLNVR